MNEVIANFAKKIDETESILITSHVGPDLDAYCSGLLAYKFISTKYPNKRAKLILQDAAKDEVNFLPYLNELSTESVLNYLQDDKPELFIMVDANNFLHFSGKDGDAVRTFVEENNITTAILDHHPEKYKEPNVDYYINRGCSSASEEVYRFFKQDLEFPTFDKVAEIAMYGILADTNRFMYENPNHKETFNVVSELLDSGVVVEELWNNVFGLKLSYSPVFAELFKNMVVEDSYNYSYLTVDFAKQYVSDGGDWEDFSNAYYLWGDLFIRYIGENIWGFTLAPDFSSDINTIESFRGSFRALKDVDTSVFANALGGGGHKLASGFSVDSNNVKDALKKVVSVIQKGN